MTQELLTLLVDRGHAVIVTLADNPAGADKLIILAALVMMFYLALRGGR